MISVDYVLSLVMLFEPNEEGDEELLFVQER